jgi:hypothetical protein
VELLLAQADVFWVNHPNSHTIFESLHCAMMALVVSVVKSFEIEEILADMWQTAYGFHKGEMV